MHSHMARQLKMIASFALLIGLLVVALELVNWMPSIIEKESLRKYKSIEFVRKNLHIERIYMPAYLPEALNVKWPPAEVYAQKKPFEMIIMHFQQRDSEEIGLIVQQIEAKAKYRPESAIKFSRIRKESSVLIKDRKGTIVNAICEDGSQCNQVWWEEGGFLLIVTGRDSQRDLIRIARSMIPDS